MGSGRPDRPRYAARAANAGSAAGGLIAADLQHQRHPGRLRRPPGRNRRRRDTRLLHPPHASRSRFTLPYAAIDVNELAQPFQVDEQEDRVVPRASRHGGSAHSCPSAAVRKVACPLGQAIWASAIITLRHAFCSAGETLASAAFIAAPSCFDARRSTSLPLAVRLRIFTRCSIASRCATT
jgi:hypothetical protein